MDQTAPKDALCSGWWVTKGGQWGAFEVRRSCTLNLSLAALTSAHDRALPSGFIEPCLPSKVDRPPSGPLWVHEIKHDGYRLMVRRDGARVRCFTRNGHDWADRFPAIVDAALRL